MSDGRGRVERPAPDPTAALRTALERLGKPRQLPQTYTVLDPETGHVRLNPDGTPFRQHYATYTVGQEDIAAIQAALATSQADDPSTVGTAEALAYIKGYTEGATDQRQADDPDAALKGRILPLPENVDPLTDRDYRRIEAHNERIYREMEAAAALRESPDGE